MNQGIEGRDQKVREVKGDMVNVTSIFQTQNKQLTEVLAKYRAPGKFCMDCCLLVLLFGLIAVIIMLIKNGKSSE